MDERTSVKIFTVVRTSNCKWWEEINALRHLYTLSIDHINFYIINSKYNYQGVNDHIGGAK